MCNDLQTNRVLLFTRACLQRGGFSLFFKCSAVFYSNNTNGAWAIKLLHKIILHTFHLKTIRFPGQFEEGMLSICWTHTHTHAFSYLHFTILTLCLLGLKKKKTFFLSNCRNQPQEKSDYKEVTRVAGI